MDFIVTMYGCMFLVGVLGNGSLGLTLCCGPGAKTRSPLLFGLIVADLLVCCLSGPITAAFCVITFTSQLWLRIALFIQAWPVTASTLSMMAISVDRYLTVKNYRPTGQVAGRRRNILIITVVGTWILGGILSITTQLIGKHPWRKTLIVGRVVIVHVMPACAVLISHLGVHSKLTALSLTARAKHGELPLPMPLLRRPTHVIIVAGVSKGRDRLSTDETNNEEINQPPTSTLRSRRRLANALLWVSIIFAICWLPYVVFTFCDELLLTPPPTYVRHYSLLLGHIHSALSPILYWAMNYQWPQRPCRFRLTNLYRSASSTNEAALGPFNPRLVRPPPMRRRSSHYLY